MSQTVLVLGTGVGELVSANILRRATLSEYWFWRWL